MPREFKSHRPKAAKPLTAAPARSAAPRVTGDDLEAAAKRKAAAAKDPKDLLDPANWPEEIGGPEGPEPTRYGDWERKGICSDF